MKSSKDMYDLVHDKAVRRVPRRYEGKLGYAMDISEIHQMFFENHFSPKCRTKDVYIREWVEYGIAMKDSTGNVLWIVDPDLRLRLEREKRNHKDCKGLTVVA